MRLRRHFLRHPPSTERDRVAELDDHRADATDPDQRGHANLDPDPDLGRASDLLDDRTRDLR